MHVAIVMTVDPKNQQAPPLIIILLHIDYTVCCDNIGAYAC